MSAASHTASRSHSGGGQSRQNSLAGDQTEAKKPYRQILLEEISEGQHELDRPPLGLLLSAVSAGLDIGFSLLLMGVMVTLVGTNFHELGPRLLSANMYAVGFLFVVLGRSELFTEHTTLAILPLLSGRSTFGAVARLWGIVYLGNLAGAAAFALLAALIGPALHIIDPAALGAIAGNVTSHPSTVIFFSAILAAWLMGLMSWLVTASRDTISQIFIVWVIAACIGIAQLHHAIVGTVEVLAGIFAGQNIPVSEFFRFLVFATLGNAVGGAVFVALLKYSHASRGESSHGKGAKL